MTELVCVRCGVVILPGAPRIEYWAHHLHPGCWDAERRATPYDGGPVRVKTRAIPYPAEGMGPGTIPTSPDSPAPA